MRKSVKTPVEKRLHLLSAGKKPLLGLIQTVGLAIYKSTALSAALPMMGGRLLHLDILQQLQLHRPCGEHHADIANHTGPMRSASHGQVWDPHKVADFVGRGGARARTQFSPLAATKTIGLCDDEVHLSFFTFSIKLVVHIF